ncbi:MAG: hypothetical protein AUG74_04460 [Bacteroidetes bacterium 13_1_20CM_4_60_6]|nr:MAG: hypothetical protein AUG74_04460 [Bacteroidetes bacterium 13_1_20CM_4_60_6]
MAVLFRTAIEAANTNPFIRTMKFEMESAGSGLSSPLRQRFSKPLLVLMTIVSVLLLLACTNVASLLLARGAARQHEMGVRICLGAGRLRLLRQVLTESLLLSVAGSLFGVYLAYFGANALLHIIRSGRMMLPPHFEIRLDPDLHVLLFTGSVALLTAVLFGLAPAVRALRTAPAAALQQSGRTGETSFRWLFGKALVVAQVAFSVMLLSAAALFLGYLSNLRNLDLGFRKDHLLLVTLDPAHSGSNNQQLARQCQQLLDRLAAIPGVRSATLSGSTPISGAVAAAFATVEGHLENRRVVSINYVAPNFFQTYSTPLLAGRDFVFRDQTGPHVAIINQAMARDYFGDDSPIGKHVTLDHVTQRGDEKPTYEIVGVVGGAKYSELREVPPRTIYLDTFQDERLGSQLTLRTGVNPEAVIPDVNQAVNELLKTVPIARVTTMADQVDAALVPERLIATLSGCFGALGTLLAAVGVYGLLAYTVTRRTHEIGIRIALGASYSKVTRMVVGDALRIAGVGTAAGTLLAFWGRRFAAHLIQDLPMKSIFPVFVGTVAMIAIALLAAYLPARRAATVDPMVALRYE